jgi:hypothetical protein
VFGNSPLGPQIAEARRQDDIVRADAYRMSARLQPATITPVPAITASIRYRIGTAMVSVGQRLSGVELRRSHPYPHSLDDCANSAIPGVR